MIVGSDVPLNLGYKVSEKKLFSTLVREAFRGQYHFLGVLGTCLTDVSERRLKDGLAASLQERPCNALAYRAGRIQSAIGSDAGFAGREDLISHRAQVNSEAVRAW